MSLKPGPPPRPYRPPWRGRNRWTLVEEILQDVHDQAWCFLGDEAPGRRSVRDFEGYDAQSGGGHHHRRAVRDEGMDFGI